MAADGPRIAVRSLPATLMEYAMSNADAPHDKLVSDFTNVLGEAEEMLKRAASETGD